MAIMQGTNDNIATIDRMDRIDRIDTQKRENHLTRQVNNLNCWINKINVWNIFNSFFRLNKLHTKTQTPHNGDCSLPLTHSLAHHANQSR